MSRLVTLEQPQNGAMRFTPEQMLPLLAGAAAMNAQEIGMPHQQFSLIREAAETFMTPGGDLATMMLRSVVDGKNPRTAEAILFAWEQALYFEDGDHSKLKGALGEMVGLSASGQSVALRQLLGVALNGRSREDAKTVMTGGMYQPNRGIMSGLLGRLRGRKPQGITQ